ncbi:hypothetical protein [Tsukamurella tyrosinosolvens]|uniref:hypothetical protein n=1 Tax=Tsukamurella tyrosinosolvens TaxID=57704 RepID=UPI0034624E03
MNEDEEAVARTLAELNALANPLGHTVTYQDGIWKSAVTGPHRSRQVDLSLDPEEIREYLDRRAIDPPVWHLDPGSGAVLECLDNEILPRVQVRDLATDTSELVRYEGVAISRSHDNPVAHDPVVWVRPENVPSIGRWFR